MIGHIHFAILPQKAAKQVSNSFAMRYQISFDFQVVVVGRPWGFREIFWSQNVRKNRTHIPPDARELTVYCLCSILILKQICHPV